jgi:hypothetical protein
MITSSAARDSKLVELESEPNPERTNIAPATGIKASSADLTPPPRTLKDTIVSRLQQEAERTARTSERRDDRDVVADTWTSNRMATRRR